MDTKTLKNQIAEKSTKALAIVDDTSRPWSERKPELDGYEAEIKSLTDDLANLTAEADARARLGANITPEAETKALEAAFNAPAVQPTVKSLGDQFVENEGYKSVLGGADGSGRRSRFSTGDIELKATFTEAAGSAGLIVPQYQTAVTQVLFKRLTVADLLASGSINGNTLIYPKESSVTNAAAAVAEGAAKPGSDLNITQVTEVLKKIATTLKVSDETLRDVAAVRSYIDARLTLFVQQAEEAELLSGSGSGAHVTGLLNRSGLTTAQALTGTPTVAAKMEAVYKQITAIRTSAFIEPDGFIINPSDWQTFRLAADANGQYFGGGPFTGAYGTSGGATDSLWGLRAVITPAITAGTALVGAFGSCAQVFRQGGITVEATNSNEDDFLNNLVALRAEERLLLGVYRPAGFGKVTGLAL